jgi:glycosyltransferase involved in cell wall biosynthesis
VKPEIAALIGVLSWVGINGTSSALSVRKAYSGIPEDPGKKVSVIMPSLAIDEYLIPKSMSSIMKSNVVEEFPDRFEFILVTDPEFQNTDCYYYYFDKIIKAPKGKLTARDMAIMEASGDIIVAVDVDRYYPPNWLNEILKPLKYNAVASTSYVIYKKVSEIFVNIPKQVYYTSKMDGGGSAFLKYAYFKSGGFNLNIDQFDWKRVEEEEEFNFKKRLSRIGYVAYVPVPNFSIVRPPAPYRLIKI